MSLNTQGFSPVSFCAGGMTYPRKCSKSNFVIVAMQIVFLVGKAAEGCSYPNIHSSSAEVNSRCRLPPTASSFPEML
jgi:hypothetical protein